MHSRDLIQFGFGIWREFSPAEEKSLVAAAPKSSGIYVLRRKANFPQLLGVTDVCYIGSTTNANGLKTRIYQYFHPGPTQVTNQRVLMIVKRLGDFEIAYTTCNTAEGARELESELLARYEMDHGELPPLNRRG